MKCAYARAWICVKLTRYHLFLSDKGGGNRFLKRGCDDDKDGLISVTIIILSSDSNWVMSWCR